VLVAAALVIVGVRVFASREMLTLPSRPYPAAAVMDNPFRYSELRPAPLIVDNRLRVYAEKWRVWSDGPVGSQYEGTPYWALRRWPAEVLGVAAAGQTVVTQWTDGVLIAIDAQTGQIAWRSADPVKGGGYDGRRTGASTVYEPRSLLTVGAGEAPNIAVVSAPGVVQAYAASTGAVLWHDEVAGGCAPAAWTSAVLVAVPDCAGTGLTLLDAVSGRPVRTWQPPVGSPAAQPSHCVLGRSDCPMLTSGGRTWLLAGDTTITDLGQLPAGALLAGDRLVYTTAAGIVSRPLTGKGPQWTSTRPGRLIAATPTRVYLLADDGTVLGLDPTVRELEALGCSVNTPKENTWHVGHVYATGDPPTPSDGEFVGIERLGTTHPSDGDEQYYFTSRPIALVQLYPVGDIRTSTHACTQD
jgi:hypothetical protein